MPAPLEEFVERLESLQRRVAELENDLQQHAELEQRVQERTTELENANQELEAFCYSVSHDLRAPLRAMGSFSRILLKDHAAALPDEVREYLQDIRANARQMGQLVDDLLAFSHLGCQPMRKQTVSPARLVNECWQELRPFYEGRCVELNISHLAECRADRALLKQVWINLFSNALKYTSKRDLARIDIGSRPGDRAGAHVYFIKDNGVGFDMKHADKLFGVFQRLHRADDYEGMGVGLAIVQRIIHRHGGRVWATAQLNQGATVCFSVEEAGLENDG